LTGRSSTPRPLDSSQASLEYWIPACAGMTTEDLAPARTHQTQFRVLAARCVRALQVNFLDPPIRGRRESRMRAAPAVPWATCTNKNAHEHTGEAEAIRLSLRNGFNGCFVLSPAIGLFCHRRLARLLARLDASVEASEPHDLAVRSTAISSNTLLCVHRIPTPRMRRS
jgi:hypothetical protein